MKNKTKILPDFHKILCHLPDLYLILDRHLVIIEASERYLQMLHQNRDEMIGKELFSIIPNLNHLQDSFHLVKTQKIADEMVIQNVFDRYCWRIQNIPILNNKKEIEYIIHHVEDITEIVNIKNIESKSIKLTEELIVNASQMENEIVQHQRKNKELQELNLLKNQFVANVSHELRTPLNAILGFANLMYYEKVGSITTIHKEYLNDIINSATHLTQLIDDILDLSKIESGKMVMHVEPLNFMELEKNIKDTFQQSLKAKKLQFIVNFPKEIKAILIDSSKLKQIIYNYISNAIKFTPEQGLITLTLKIETNILYLEVGDTGIGLKEEDIEHLFVAFQQLDSSTRKLYQGSGLGLALVHKLVTTMGGRVGVTSRLGVGSVFYVILPLKNEVLVNS